jgi:hypothetical protein
MNWSPGGEEQDGIDVDCTGGLRVHTVEGAR